LWKVDEDGDGLAEHFECLDQWNFVRRGRYGPWAFNQRADCTDFERLKDFELNRPEWIIRETSMPINEVGLMNYIGKAFAIRDWGSFVDIYGVPSWLLVAPPDARAEDIEQLECVAAKLSRGGTGALPNGTDAKAASPGASSQPFEPFLRYYDTELVIAATAGKLTMLTESGSGTLAGSAHSETFDQLADAEAAEISEVFQRDYDKPLLRQKFPGQPVLAYFDICSPSDAEADASVKQINSLASAGYSVNPEQIEERTGFHVTVRTPQIVQMQMVNQASDLGVKIPQEFIDRSLDPYNQDLARNRAGDQHIGYGDVRTSDIYSATSRDLRPIIRRLRDIEQMTSVEAQVSALKSLLDAYGDLAKEVLENSDSADEWEKLLGSAMVNGMTH
jgi:phage gp29-like protein